LQIYFSVFSLVLVLIEKLYQALKTVFDHISKHLEVCQKYCATRHIFNSLFGVWECGQTLPFVFDILRKLGSPLGLKMKVENDHRSKFPNLSNWKEA